MKKFMRIDGKELNFPIFLMNDNDVALQDFTETEMIQEMCKPHIEEYDYREVSIDVIESTDPMVNPFGCEEEQQMHIVSMSRLKNWPHVMVREGTPRLVQTIGSFNRIWDAIDTYGLI